MPLEDWAELSRFQSTLPVWGRTKVALVLPSVYRISIHPPRKGRDQRAAEDAKTKAISIHPPRKGRDVRVPYSPVR